MKIGEQNPAVNGGTVRPDLHRPALDLPAARPFSRTYSVVFVLGALLVLGLTATLIRSEYLKALAEWQARQTSIAVERSRRLSDWLSERRAEGEVFATRPSVRSALLNHYTTGHLPGRSRDLTGVLDQMASVYGYAGVYVLDRDAGIVARSSNSVKLSPPLAGFCQIAASKKASEIDLLGDTPDRTLISFITPVFSGGTTTAVGQSQAELLGIALVVQDATQSLFPLTTQEGVPTKTGETILVYRKGGDVLFFSPLRFRPAGSQDLRFPLPNAPLPARSAAEGRETFLESTDYRGVLTLSATRHVNLTDWGLIRKIDRAEALEDFHRTAWAEAVAAGLLLVAFGGLLAVHQRSTLARVVKAESERFRAVLESAPDAMVITDHAGSILLVNSATESMFGYAREELLGRPVQMLTPERTPRGLFETDASAPCEHSAPKRSDSLERYAQRKDGSTFPIELTLSPVEVSGGAGAITAFRDISERRRVEEALQQSEMHFRSLFENMLNGFAFCRMIFEQDRPQDFIYLSVNKAFGSLTGLANVVGKKVSEVIPGIREADPELLEIYGRVALTGIPEQFETYVDALQNWFSISVYSPQKEYFVAVFDVITERKRAEEALRRSRAGLAEAQRIAHMGNWEWDITNDRAYWSEEMYRIFGGQPGHQTVTLENSLMYMHPDDRGLVQAALKEALRGEKPYEIEYRIVRPDGSERFVHAQGEVFLDAGHKPVRMLGIVQDITARKQAEEEIRKLNEELEHRVMVRTSQLEAANKELESFSYSVSHDLRAPLRHIDGFSRILSEEYQNQLAPDAQEYITIIRDSVRQMGMLIDDLLNLARVGRTELRFQATSLGSLASEVIEELKHANPSRAIEWRVHPLPVVECDRALMRQVFVNLLSNAVKFTRPRELAVIEVGACNDQNQPAVYIRDNGAGFDMKYADKLFGVFQRLHRAEDFEGTGVGLAIVQRVIHKHGGRAWAEGEPDRGATFYFTLGAADDLGSKSAVGSGGMA